MKTTAVFVPFALFGSPGAAQGAELLADALREMLADNRRETRPTRSRAYQPHVRVRELPFAAQSDYADQPSDHGRSLIVLLDLTTMEGYSSCKHA